MSSGALAGKICLVTGATRGIGRGIALQLGQAGATVYITGRTLKPTKSSGVGGSLEETAAEIEARGGKCIPVQCDHSKEAEVGQLFAKIKADQHGQLDILINNAYAGVMPIFEGLSEQKKFWETDDPAKSWDVINNVGLRNHYICTIYAAQMMVPRKQGLIIMISSGGGLKYLFNVPYGVGKAACDRMAADCAHELRQNNVACVSLWPGAVRTEHINNLMPSADQKTKALFDGGETTEYSGCCIVGLANDSNLMSKSGKILTTSGLAREYNISSDVDGGHPTDLFTVRGLISMAGWKKTAAFVPSFLRIPGWLVTLQMNKFY